MIKNIAVFVDGTGNSGSEQNPDNTNVFRMSRMLEPAGQCWIYVAGIGTHTPEPGSWFGRLPTRARNLIEQAFGIGATERVQKAYQFLAEHYEKNDRIYLFGFSRGAFIVRTLAGFIKRVGLLFKSASMQRYVAYAFYLYWLNRDREKFDRFVHRMEKRAGTNAEGIDTHFLGQWDTVEALFEPVLGADTEVRLRQIADRERNQPLPTWIGNASHALAIHDLRSKFAPLLWSGVSESRQVLDQVWFAGAHADVGGGYENYPSPGTKFSDITLDWMRRQAGKANLKLVDWRPPESFGSGFTPHITHPIHELLGPTHVRQALHQSSGTDAIATVLHPSAISRLLEPASALYDTLDQSIRSKWIDADSAAMQLHYKQWYPRRRPFPMLSPATLHGHMHRLEQAMHGKRRISKRRVVEALSLIAIFDREFFDRSLPKNLPGDVSNSLEFAARALERELRPRRTSHPKLDHRALSLALVRFTLELTLPEKGLKSKRLKI